MAQTPNTSLTPYLTGLEIQAFIDLRTLADYLGDHGQRYGGTDPDPAIVAASPILLELTKAASGELESAAFVSEAYSPADLQAILAGNGNGAAKIRELVAGLLLRRLFRRRPQKQPPQMDVVDEAEQWLALLAEGKRIFGTLEASQAGLPDVHVESPAEYQARQGMVVVGARFFGRRAGDRQQWN